MESTVAGHLRGRGEGTEMTAPSFDNLQQLIEKAADRMFQHGRLDALNEEACHFEALRKSSESSDPQSVTTFMHMYRLDAHAEDLRCRIGLAKKLAGGTGE